MVDEMTERENKMGVMPVRRLVFTMSLPAMISMLIGALYNIVESVFVAMIGEASLAAITLVFPIQMFMIAVGIGSGVGLNSLISRRLGQKLQERADTAASHGFFVAVVNWLIFAAFGLFFAGSFMGLYTSDEYILGASTLYCQMVTIGSLFSFVAIVCERTLQATGRMIPPMIFNITGAVLNIILSPILILGLFGIPRLEILGAGLACLISQFVSAALALFLLFGFKQYVKIKLRGFRPEKDTLKDIYKVGLPTIITMSINSVAIIGINAILIGYSAAAIAVYGLYFRINSFVFMPLFGINQGSLSIMGYNYGASNKKRLMQTIKTTMSTGACIMAVGTAIFWLFTKQLLMLFSATPEMLEIGIPALRIISIGFIPAAVCIASTAFFQALAHAIFSMIITLMRQMIIALPLAWLLSSLFGLEYLWFALAIAEISAAVLTFFLIIKVYRKEVIHL